MRRISHHTVCGFVALFLAAAGMLDAADPIVTQQAQEVLQAAALKGGLIVHIGCGNGELTAALRTGDQFQVHGLDTEPGPIAAARQYLQSQGLYGPVAVDMWDGRHLPYIDNLVNLVVVEDVAGLPMKEIMRVLCPEGVACIRRDGRWTKTVKPRPAEIDEWTHYLHDASNNAVAHDSVIGPPRRMQWLGSPRYSRHHDRMSGVSAAVSSGGRVFYIFDEAAPVSILLPPKWSLIARDAFNGIVLWKRPIASWHTHLWPLKSGPAQLPRRLVASGDRVYVTLSYDGPVTVLDAATGEIVFTCEGTEGTEEIILHGGILYALVNTEGRKPDYAKTISTAYRDKFYDELPRQIVALRAGTGEELWRSQSKVLPATLAVSAAGVFFHDGERVACLDRQSGEPHWKSEPVARSQIIGPFFLPTLVLYEDVVLFAGGETAGAQTGSWYMSGEDTMTALSAKSGEKLWTAYHPPSGYRSPEDLLVVNGLVWTGETTSGRAMGVFTGRDLHTGEIKKQFPPDVDVYWFHHRCYRGKATDKYLLMSRTGTEFIDVHNEKWTVNHWVRGACLYGILPANGLLYNPPHPCACYLESKLYGFNALAAAGDKPRIDNRLLNTGRFEKGPAYDKIAPVDARRDDWPTYRRDPARSGAGAAMIASLKPAWQADIGGRLTSPVISNGTVYVAAVDAHTLHALDAASGKPLWQYSAGGRIDSPPTIYAGRVLFGCADGRVYCLRAADGVLAWRFRAAPVDERMMAFEQLESVWPVHGSVLVAHDTLYCVAGRSMFVDDGLRFIRLDAKTGRLLSETVCDERDPYSAKTLHDYVQWLNMPVALPDILSTDGRFIYMRGQAFRPDGTRMPLEKLPPGADADQGAPPAIQRDDRAHLFSPTGFLDDTWWHRTYWMYGSQFISGWCGYFLSGKVAPSGRILCFDDATVYGFGRKPQYYRWTTPIEHHLFAADKAVEHDDTPPGAGGKSFIEVAKSASLNAAGKPVTVCAWIQTEKPNGVILARGGNAQGYALYLLNKKPQFAVRIDGTLFNVAGDVAVSNAWAHVAGVLTADNKLHVYVDGKSVGSANAGGLPAADPAEAMHIGADEGSTVGDYDSGFGFAGLIDDVCVYHRALTPEEIARHASGNKADNPVLVFNFDDDPLADLSGNANVAKAEGVKTVKGKWGNAIRFAGTPANTPGFLVRHQWTKDLPIFARAMVLAGETLFVAGPPDMIDEPQAFSRITDEEIAKRLAEQADAIAGANGASLMAVSTADPDTSVQYELESPPVFDGMAAARGRLYISAVNGRILCMESEQSSPQLTAAGRQGVVQ